MQGEQGTWARGDRAAPDDTARAAAALFERLPEAVAGDGSLERRGRFLTVDCLVQIGTVPFHLSIVSGRIAALERGPHLMRSWTFAVRAAAEAWTKFWQPVPEPGYHDLFALTRRGEATIEGDLRPLMANLLYIKALLSAPRRLAAGG